MTVSSVTNVAQRTVVLRPVTMAELACVGFDLDGTLAVYRSAQIELIVERAVGKLIARGYAPEIERLRYDPRFAIRGLVLDKRHGNVLQLAVDGGVARAFHGLTSLSRPVLDELYPRTAHITPGLLHFEAETVFSLPLFVLFATLLDFLEKQGRSVGYNRLFADILRALNDTLRDDGLGATPDHAWDRYVHADEELAALLAGLRAAKKRVFLLTNATWAHTARVLTWLFGEAAALWSRSFDVICVEAQKPQFFTARNEVELITPDEVTVPVMRHGHHAALERHLDARAEQILYVGDCHREDIAPARDVGWHTAFVVSERGGWAELAGSLDNPYWGVDDGAEPFAVDVAHRAARHASLLLGRAGDLRGV